MIVWHGSPHKFDTFDSKYIRTNGTSEGVGYYFTDNLKIGKGYGQDGYLYHVQLKLNKPLSDNKMTLTEKQAHKIIIAIDNEVGYLDNYGEVDYEGYENVLNTALEHEYRGCDTDTDFMGALYNACGESERVLDLFYTVLGYDHVVAIPEWGQANKEISHKVYIALTNDIIKIKDRIKI